MNTTYPLGHTSGELDRLDTQALLLRDAHLEQLAANATSCLEIGCGNGSNVPLLQAANPNLSYTGIDMAASAIEAAKSRYGGNAAIEFLEMDASSLTFENGSFDLVFTKLVLWSVGPAWTTVLTEAHRLLAPGGTFYALEPCNQLIEFYPEKPAARAWMQSWDEAAVKTGLDPYIGTKVSTAMDKVGFVGVDAKFFPVIAPGSEEDRYKAIINNLKGFYLGPATQSLGLDENTAMRHAASKEFDTFSPDHLVTDALFVTWGTK